MRTAILLLGILVAVGMCEGDSLYYHDYGFTGATHENTYRGTWFDVQDFIPGMTDGYLYQAEIWFGTGYWDTSDVYIEIWNGDEVSGPKTQVDQRMITAEHYPARTFVDYLGEGCPVEQNFWLIVNTEMSSGGWPSTCVGLYPCDTPHSFFSDDFDEWAPWFSPDSNSYHNIVTVQWGEYPLALNAATWGSIKTTF